MMKSSCGPSTVCIGTQRSPLAAVRKNAPKNESCGSSAAPSAATSRPPNYGADGGSERAIEMRPFDSDDECRGEAARSLVRKMTSIAHERRLAVMTVRDF